MKQVTLEELAKDFYSDDDEMMLRIAFKRGYTECEERMYSEEEVLDLLYKLWEANPRNIKEWFEQFKKKA
jgi:hypothetical protein